MESDAGQLPRDYTGRLPCSRALAAQLGVHPRDEAVPKGKSLRCPHQSKKELSNIISLLGQWPALGDKFPCPEWLALKWPSLQGFCRVDLGYSGSGHSQNLVQAEALCFYPSARANFTDETKTGGSSRKSHNTHLKCQLLRASRSACSTQRVAALSTDPNRDLSPPETLLSPG